MPTTVDAASEPRHRSTSSNAASVAVLAVAFLGALTFAFLAFGASLCGLFGETCTPEEEAQVAVWSLASLASLVVPPVVVATIRRQLRWLLAPVLEVGAVVFFFALIGWF